jgi:UDP-GlcNAc:undecaprenyl-phosphate GlcNAc-1-phosphate transferase
MTYIFAALVVSFVVTLVIIRVYLARTHAPAHFVEHRRAEWIRASSLHGLRRAGGIGVAAGILVSLLARLLDDAPVAPAVSRMGLTLLASAAPVFAAGLMEDMTQRLSIAVRLVAAFVSAALAGWLLGAWITRLDVPLLDPAFGIAAVSVIFTCLLVAGLTNAFNIIDGFNGLAGGVASLILLGIAYVALKVNDIAVLAAALTAIGAILGFMLLNFPRGLVYLGDGGAYLLGFWIGVLLILLVGRNPGVSAWFPVLLCSYPVCELLFSIYRRLIVRRVHPGLPDAAHLHHLIYKRLVRWLVGTDLAAHKTQRNALTAPYLWIITSIGVAPAVAFWKSTTILQIGCAVFTAAYIYGYTRIVKFRAPRWWVMRKSR